MKSYRRFNLSCLTVTLSGFLAVGAFNAIVDPFGVINSPMFSGFNSLKPDKFNHVRLFKATDVVRIKPESVLLGSSRTDLGKVFISPSHATQLEAVNQAGLWSEFENWQREIVKIAPIWDFYGYNSITTEPISDGMKNYWDSSHYRKEVGDLVLNRMFNVQEEKVPDDFGVLLTQENIESHLEKKHADRAVWAKNNPDLVQLVQNVKRQVNDENK